MAEMMVQRTRAAQAERAWVEFVSRFPTLADAAAASDDELRRPLANLGLRWRTENIVATIRLLDTAGGRRIPQTPTELEKLPGVGHYAASAVCTVAFGRRIAVIDANIVRVFSRFFGIPRSDTTRRESTFHNLVVAMTPHRGSERFFWALLDLGALVCRPTKPDCRRCPFQRRCEAALMASSGQTPPEGAR